MSFDHDASMPRQLFSHFVLPQIDFGSGVRRLIASRARRFGPRILLITGAQSLQRGPFWPEMLARFEAEGLEVLIHAVADEPSPHGVDAVVREYHSAGIAAVVAIGGGSALDAAKAIAGLLPSGDSVLEYLEGVGPQRPYHGPALPLIAAPTTAGTGAEMSKNAVLSVRGGDGYKKSFRSDLLMARHALIDPDFLQHCPPEVLAGNGMDALTQLLESYVSRRAYAHTDALVLSALHRLRVSLLPLVQDSGNAEARSGMAYAAMVSGITLSQVGLGVVHGLASPLGAFFPIPHGLVCGALLAPATHSNIEALRHAEPGSAALQRYATLGRVLAGNPALDDNAAHDALIQQLYAWSKALGLPTLGALGVTAQDYARIIAHCRGSSMQTNPIHLSDAQLAELLARCQTTAWLA
ncbi:iron-containing alcohol dehydrogenase [Thiorhodospira sibirica]|uniref:iron-containing alcohol dehydrogenase n=1 Tax=Thiorhodospira sibirica TaxID=154347 RepID=UPI00022C1777|nr:iron-containing alcohol dehydrogenase [Thiorhodospira sibirica]